MIVGLARITLHLPDNHSLKGKRQVVRKICERIRNRFHISIAEVAHLDFHQSCQLGFAFVGNETPFVQSVVDQVIQAVEDLQLAPILERETEIIHFKDSGSHEQPPHAHSAGWDFIQEWDPHFSSSSPVGKKKMER